MTNWDKLYTAMSNAGMTATTLSKACGYSHSWLHNKRKRNADFTSTEITSICTVLGVDFSGREDIFFANNVDLQSTEETA